MYREEVYLPRLHAQLKAIMRSRERGALTISDTNNPLYCPANILLGFTNSLIAELKQKRKTAQEFIYLIVALKLVDESYLPTISQFKEMYPEMESGQTVDKLVEYFKKASSLPKQNTDKEHLKRQFEKCLGKAEFQGYFRIPQVPVFLISTHWLEKFYSPEFGHPGPINNRMLLQSTPFPLAESNYSHFNYRVRSDVRENSDFKVLPYEAWKLLYQTYGGVEAKRFTTKQKKPTVDIWYVNTVIWVVEERSVLIKLQIMISKNETIQQVLERVKITLKKYKAVPESYLARQPAVYKLSGLEPDQFTALLHSQSQSHFLTQKMERIKKISIQFEEATIFSDRQALVINYVKGLSSVFDKVPLLKVIELKEKCLRCEGTDSLELCKCKTVYFCSKNCRDAHKDHLKQCNNIQGQQKKLASLIRDYDVKKRSWANFGSIISLGKVGMVNLGNTCYMNAAIQCVLRIQPLVRFFLANGHLKDLNVTNVLGSEGYLACAFGELVKNFYTTTRRSLQPASLLRIIAHNPQFRGYNHQDSQQFLNYFLDKLHEDLNRIKSKPYLEQIESNGRPDEIVSEQSWSNYLKRNNSLIVDIFAGQYRSEIRCPDCQRLSIVFDPFLSLTLQFPKPEKGIEVKGSFMNEMGQFQPFTVEVRSSTVTSEFYEKYFGVRAHGVLQSDKKILSAYDPNLTVFQNQKPRGILFVFEKPYGHAVEIQLQIKTAGSKEAENWVRIVFAKDVSGQEEIKRLAFLAIRKPIEKAIGKDYNQQDYLNICKELDFLQIVSLSRQPQSKTVFPVTGAAVLKVVIQIDQSKIKLKSPIKLNSQSSKFDGKNDLLIRKMSNVLSMQELLQCFSQPERLTQENAWYCNVCKDHKLADKAMQLYKVPKFLIVHLKRFNHRGDSGNRYIIYGEKVNTPIALSQFEMIKGKRYQLIGVVNHVGNLMHGHYTAMVKRDEWYNYDDSHCARTSLDGRYAYLLFYQLVE